MRRGLLLLLPVSLILAIMASVAYFIWWDANHCTLCRAHVDEFGSCPNPDCHLNRLTTSRQETQDA